MHLLPRYRQRLAFVPFNLAHASWEDDPNFALDNHLIRHPLPRGTSVPGLVKAALEIYEPALDHNRPVCEIHLFEGIEGGRSAILWKVHHCLVNGVSGMEFLTVMMDLGPMLQPASPRKAVEAGCHAYAREVAHSCGL